MFTGKSEFKPRWITPAVVRAGILATLLGLSFLIEQAAAERPNIVLIMADDMGYSDIGCYGGEHDTPQLDALANNGVRFTQFYNTGRCCPTRASLLTGLYAHQAGIGHMVYRDKGPGYHTYLNDRCVTLGEVLGQAGYRTMMTGKWHVGHKPGQWPTDRGFEKFYGIHIHVDSYFKVLRGCPVYHDGELVIPPTADPPNQLHPDQEWYTTDVFTDWSLKFLDQAKEDPRPFFLYVAYNSPHWPLEAPQENIEAVGDRYAVGWDRLRADKLERMKQMGLIDASTELPPSGCPAWDSLDENDQGNLAFRRAIYAAQIERMDRNIGRIVEKLRQMDALDNTLLVFLSDNGCCAEGGMFGFRWKQNKLENFPEWRTQSGRSSSTGEAWSNASNAPFRLHKRWVHEGGIATPLIVHWPERVRQAGQWTRQVGHVIDLMPTFLEVAEADYPDQFNGNSIKPLPGQSLLDCFQDVSIRRDRRLFWEHESHAAIRVGEWKLVTRNAKQDDQWELYDLTAGRNELDNQIDQQPQRAQRMKEQWFYWAEKSNVLPWPSDRNQNQ